MSEEIKDVEVEDTQEETQEEEVFTKEELEKRLQSETDRRVSMAIAKREEAMKEEMMAQIEKERKEAEELAKLSEKERAAKELELKEQELEKERKIFYRERLELQTSKELDKLGLPISFTEYVIGEDAEVTHDRIKEFHELWETELERRRIESMKGKTPTIGGKSAVVTQEEFDKMDYVEKRELYNTNIELYRELAK